MPLFVLTPATLVWSPIFAGYSWALAAQVSFYRIRTNKFLGTGDDAVKGPHEIESKVTKDPIELAENNRKLVVATRAYGNFTEAVPLALLLIAIAEINQAPTRLVHGVYATLFALRIAHVELGIKLAPTGLGRLVGAHGTFLLTTLTGIYNFYLGFDSLKAYLGF